MMPTDNPETDMAERLARVADIQKTAQAILDDPEAAAALHRVGVSGDFTLREHEAIHERLGLGKYDPYDNIISALDYQGIVQALARRVAAGFYRTVFDDEAHAWVLSNTFVKENYKRIYDQRITFEDFLVVLREFMAWDKVPEHIQAMRACKGENMYQDLDDAAAPLYAKSKELFRKYGFIEDIDVVGVALRLFRDDKAADDVDAVRYHVTLLFPEKFSKGIEK